MGNYLSSQWFKVDRIAVIPFEVFFIFSGYYIVFRISKLIRVLQIKSTLTRFQKNLEECAKITMSEVQVSGFLMFIFTVLIIVWSSAGWNAIRKDDTVYNSVYWALSVHNWINR